MNIPEIEGKLINKSFSPGHVLLQGEYPVISIRWDFISGYKYIFVVRDHFPDRDRWMALPVGKHELTRFFQGEISLRDIQDSLSHLLILDLFYNGVERVYEVKIGDLPEDYNLRPETTRYNPTIYTDYANELAAQYVK